MSISMHRVPLRSRSVGEIAAAVPGATEVFRRFRLDFCCGGDVVLDDGARQHGVDAAILEKEINELQESSSAAPASREIGELIDHILARYHETHRRELPKLIKLAPKVEAVHAGHTKVPDGLAETIQEMLDELESAYEKGRAHPVSGDAKRSNGGLDAPIAQMRHDHDDHGIQLRKLESLTDNFTLPEGACRSWQALYTGSAKVANDLMELIHLENHALSPKYEDAPRT